MSSTSWVRCGHTPITRTISPTPKAIFENFVGFNSELSTLLISKTTILAWLLTRIQSKEHDDNRGYAAELLSILLQNNRDNRLAFGKQDGVEIALKVLSVSTTNTVALAW